MSGRIVTHLDKGLGWTRPVVVACCGDCGTELARSTTATDVAVARGRWALASRQRWPPDLQPTPRLRRAGRR